MGIFDHLGLLFVIFLFALIVFGPKRMIAMVTNLMDTLRQTRDAMRQMSWTLTEEDQPATTQRVPPATPDHLNDDNVVDAVTTVHTPDEQ
jgi:Sec-independent protein translocase protein TatA